MAGELAEQEEIPMEHMRPEPLTTVERERDRDRAAGRRRGDTGETDSPTTVIDRWTTLSACHRTTDTDQV